MTTKPIFLSQCQYLEEERYIIYLGDQVCKTFVPFEKQPKYGENPQSLDTGKYIAASLLPER